MYPVSSHLAAFESPDSVLLLHTQYSVDTLYSCKEVRKTDSWLRSARYANYTRDNAYTEGFMHSTIIHSTM